MRFLSGLLRKFIRNGTLRLHDADGRRHDFGDGRDPVVTARLHDRSLYWKLVLNPELYAAEAYMDGTLTFEDGSSVHDFLPPVLGQPSGLGSTGSQKLLRRAWRGAKRWQQANPLGKAATNVRHHYDLSDGALPALPRRGHEVFLRLFPRSRDATPWSRRSATS